MLKKNMILILLILSGFTGHAQKKGDQSAVNQLLDGWHEAAAAANLDAYFGSLSEDAIYLGTDPGERWTKKMFYDFSKPHFDKGKAWDFKPYDRTLYFTPNGKFAWFEESLDTWMGVCRGSGVVKKVKKKWKIVHYNLAIAVPNEVTQNYLKVLGDFNKKKE